MSTAATRPPTHHDERMLGQTVVVIGGSSGIGLETARQVGAMSAPVTPAGRPTADRG